MFCFEIPKFIVHADNTQKEYWDQTHDTRANNLNVQNHLRILHTFALNLQRSCNNLSAKKHTSTQLDVRSIDDTFVCLSVENEGCIEKSRILHVIFPFQDDSLRYFSPTVATASATSYLSIRSRFHSPTVWYQSFTHIGLMWWMPTETTTTTTMNRWTLKCAEPPHFNI